jgi:hypothetical protein
MKTKILLIIAVLVCSCLQAQVTMLNVKMNGVGVSQLSPYSAWTFDTETQTITAYDGSLGADVTIPASINGVDVLHIGDSACENKGISTITLPEGLLTIAVEAFKDNSITAATAPSTLTSIGSNAFSGNNITSWWLPDNVTLSNNIYTMSSYYGSALYSIYYQEGRVGGHFSSYQAVGGFPWIRHDISPTHLAAYTISGDTITAYNVGAGGTIAVLPFTKDDVTITKIHDYAFQNKGLTGLRFPTQTYGGQFPGGGQYTHIGAASFNSNNISIVQLPGSLVSTGVNSFNGCGATMVAVSSSPTYGSATFNHNYGLTSISWLMSVPNISMLMFGGCISLSSVLLHYGTVDTPDPSGLNNYSDVITIGDSAFISSAITQITIPSTCTSVGIGAFNTQSGISKIIIPAGVSIAHANSFNDIGNTQASFKDFYEAGGSLNGTYEYSGGAWSKTY